MSESRAATNRDLEHGGHAGQLPSRSLLPAQCAQLAPRPCANGDKTSRFLIGHFLDRVTRTSGQEKVLSDDALKALLAYDWPGNVRELENCLERSYAFTSGPTIHTMDLPREIANLAVPQSSNGNGNGNGHSKIVPIAAVEKQTILRAIMELNGDKLQAARLLGIGKTTLYRKLKDYAAKEC